MSSPTPETPLPVFLGQREIFRQRFPALAPWLDNAPGSQLYLSLARSGAPTARIVESAGAVHLHSAYDPAKEAAQFLDEAGNIVEGAVALLGLGLGYVAIELFRRTRAGQTILLFEPDAAALRAALDHLPLEPLLRSERVHWFADASVDAHSRRMLDLSIELADGVKALAPAASRRRLGARAATFRESLEHAVAYARIARSTRLTQGRRAMSNLVGNLRRYARSSTLASKAGAARGKPVIVVAAGPSLAKNRERLHEAAGRATIIVVGTALRQVLALEIVPDFVCQIDHSDLCLRHFEGLTIPSATTLVADPRSSPVVLDQWSGALAMTRDVFAERILGEAATAMAPLPHGTTVAHTAFYLARFLGADPIIFVGLDLAFADGVYYSGGVGLHEIWNAEVNRFRTVETLEWERLARRKKELLATRDAEGRPLLTDRQMVSYLRQFERDFADAGAMVIDATEGGAVKAGAEAMSLSDAIARYVASAATPNIVADRREPPLDRTIASEIAAAKERFRTFKELMVRMANGQEKALGFRGDPRRAADTLAAFVEPLANQVARDFTPEFQMCVELDGSIEENKRLATLGLPSDPADRLIAEVERDRAYVTALAAAAEEWVTLLIASPA